MMMTNIIWNTPDNKPPDFLLDQSREIPKGKLVKQRNYQVVPSAISPQKFRCMVCFALCHDDDETCPKCGRTFSENTYATLLR